jgi:nucleoside-diphosphate-sugar epimerase
LLTALVSGGAGQIGSHLCRSLLDSGQKVICIDNLSTGERLNIADLEDRPDFTFLEADVVKPLKVTEPLGAVYHLASPASPPEYVTIPLETLAVNSQGTWNLLRLAEAHHARFLFASTSEVYGDPEVHPQTEEYWGRVNPNGVRSCYDESKRFGEALTASYVRSRGADARMVRIFNTYGPNCRPADGRMVPNFISQALRGEPLTIYGSGIQTRSLCYVSDTVAGIRLTMERDLQSGVVINIGNPDERTVMEFAREIAAACQVEFKAVHLELPSDDPSRRCPDISRAKRLLDWEPKTSLEVGIGRTVDWLRPLLASTTAPISHLESATHPL